MAFTRGGSRSQSLSVGILGWDGPALLMTCALLSLLVNFKSLSRTQKHISESQTARIESQLCSYQLCEFATLIALSMLKEHFMCRATKQLFLATNELYAYLLPSIHHDRLLATLENVYRDFFWPFTLWAEWFMCTVSMNIHSSKTETCTQFIKLVNHHLNSERGTGSLKLGSADPWGCQVYTFKFSSLSLIFFNFAFILVS